jgi:hypothetical protein
MTAVASWIRLPSYIRTRYRLRHIFSERARRRTNFAFICIFSMLATVFKFHRPNGVEDSRPCVFFASPTALFECQLVRTPPLDRYKQSMYGICFLTSRWNDNAYHSQDRGTCPRKWRLLRGSSVQVFPVLCRKAMWRA